MVPSSLAQQAPRTGQRASYPDLFYAWTPSVVGAMMSNDVDGGLSGRVNMTVTIKTPGVLPYPAAAPAITFTDHHLRKGFTALLWFVPRKGVSSQYGGGGRFLCSSWYDIYNNKRSTAFFCGDDTWGTIIGAADGETTTRATLTLASPAVNTPSLAALRISPTAGATLPLNWWFNGAQGEYTWTYSYTSKPILRFVPLCSDSYYPQMNLYGDVLCLALLERYVGDDELTTLWPTPYAVYPQPTYRRLFAPAAAAASSIAAIAAYYRRRRVA